MAPVTSLILRVCAKCSVPGDIFLEMSSIPRVQVKLPEGLSTTVGEATSAACPHQSLCGYLPYKVFWVALCNQLSSAGAQVSLEGCVYKTELVGPLHISHLILGWPLPDLGEWPCNFHIYPL